MAAIKEKYRIARIAFIVFKFETFDLIWLFSRLIHCCALKILINTYFWNRKYISIIVLRILILLIPKFLSDMKSSVIEMKVRLHF